MAGSAGCLKKLNVSEDATPYGSEFQTKKNNWKLKHLLVVDDNCTDLYATTLIYPYSLLRAVFFSRIVVRVRENVAVKRKETRARRFSSYAPPSRLAPILLTVLVLISRPTSSFRAKSIISREKRETNGLQAV